MSPVPLDLITLSMPPKLHVPPVPLELHTHPVPLKLPKPHVLLELPAPLVPHTALASQAAGASEVASSTGAA